MSEVGCSRRSMVAMIAAGLATSACGVAPEPPEVPEPMVDAALEQEMRRIEVVMFMTDWCPHCRRARRWLSRRGYKFIELDVERNERAAEVLQALNPRGSVPMFDVEGQVLVGFDPFMLHAAIQRAVERRAGTGLTGFARAD